jgi:hypothetical protein
MAAAAHIEEPWGDFAPGSRSWVTGTPALDIRANNDINGGLARARALEHKIIIDARFCRRSWLVHEIAHLLNPAEQHGVHWRETVMRMRMWRQEFGIKKPGSLWVNVVPR